MILSTFLYTSEGEKNPHVFLVDIKRESIRVVPGKGVLFSGRVFHIVGINPMSNLPIVECYGYRNFNVKNAVNNSVQIVVEYTPNA